MSLILTLAIASACSSPKEKIDQTDSTALSVLRSSIDSLISTQIPDNAPGAAVLVAHDGEMLIGKGYGLRDLKSQAPVTASTNFRMASVSKQFTALCVLDLVDQGLLSLNDSITKFWPYPVFNNITLKQLLNHTSGLADYELTPYFSEEWDKSIVVENKHILQWLATNPEPIFEPGINWEYSNTAYLVLALLVEKVSGQEFASYAKEHIFEKAGMTNTTFYNLAHPVKISERSFCHDKDSLGNWEKIDGFYMNGILGDGAVYTSINDYFTYDNALRKQTILPKEMHELVFKPSASIPEAFYDFNFLNGAQEKYGMAWFLTEKFALHTGSWNGTRTIVVREFERPLTIAIFLNSNSSEARVALIEATYSLVDEYLNTKNK